MTALAFVAGVFVITAAVTWGFFASVKDRDDANERDRKERTDKEPRERP